jgi:hypothetical protein
MPMRHNKHVSPFPTRMPLSSDLPNQLIHSLCNLFRRLSTFTPIAPDIPVALFASRGTEGTNLGGGEPFVVPVVPFAYQGCDACVGVAKGVGRGFGLEGR